VSTPGLRPAVFITGASSGIGAAAVELFARAGYDVALGARRQEKLAAVSAQVAQCCPQAGLLPVRCDVDDDASVRDALGAIKTRFGRLDVLVNNAGFGVYGSVAATPLERFRANMETNYFGVIRCTQAALPLLRATAAQSTRRWGAAIVMVSSFVGRRGLPLMSSSCATKFTLEGLSESLRVELRDERISVSVVNPGVTQTEFVASAKGERPANYIPPKNGMTSAAVAQVILNCVRRPRRNVYLTGAGKAGIALQWLSPRVFDRLLLKYYRETKAQENA